MVFNFMCDGYCTETVSVKGETSAMRRRGTWLQTDVGSEVLGSLPCSSDPG
jgi:hypothetical protein